jgi:hypothetical protein
MAAQRGRMLNWAAVILAGLFVIMVVIGYASNSGEGVHVISTASLLARAAIFLVGWTCRRLLTAR